MSSKYLTLLLILAITSCSVKPAKTVFKQPDNQKKYNIYSLITQEQLEPFYDIEEVDHADISTLVPYGLVGDPLSSAAGYITAGIILSSVDAANQQKNKIIKQNIDAVRSELVGLDFAQVFEDEVVKKMHHSVRVNQVKTVKSQRQVARSVSDGEIYVLLTTSYKMDIDYRTPVIITNARIIKKSDPKNKQTKKILYENTFTYFGVSLPDPQQDQATIIKKRRAQLLALKEEKISKMKAAWESAPNSFKEIKRNQTNFEKRLQIVEDSPEYKIILPDVESLEAEKLAKIAKIKANWEQKNDSIKRDPKRQKQYQNRLKAAENIDITSPKFYLTELEANQTAATAWTKEYKSELEKNLRDGIQNLLTLISDDIKDPTPPSRYHSKGITLIGYPESHKSMIINETEQDIAIRFTEGTRAGAICAMKKKSNTSEKLVCL